MMKSRRMSLAVIVERIGERSIKGFRGKAIRKETSGKI
jgi:hypothetical protein